LALTSQVTFTFPVFLLNLFAQLWVLSQRLPKSCDRVGFNIKFLSMKKLMSQSVFICIIMLSFSSVGSALQWGSGDDCCGGRWACAEIIEQCSIEVDMEAELIDDCCLEMTNEEIC